jgi:hypothetical protein
LIGVAVVGLGNDYRGDSRFPYLNTSKKRTYGDVKAGKREKQKRGEAAYATESNTRTMQEIS